MNRQLQQATWPRLRFTPTAWAKLVYLRDCGDTEVGGFGIADSDDLLLVTDLELVQQRCSAVTVAFDDIAVADFFDRQVDRGLYPNQFGRIWVHTHPGNSAEPSSVDEETFERVFGHADWALMFILAAGGQCYARLQFNVGPGGAIEVPVEVDYSLPFAASDHADWHTQYLTKVTPIPLLADTDPKPDSLSLAAELSVGAQRVLAAADYGADDPFYVEDYWYGW